MTASSTRTISMTFAGGLVPSVSVSAATNGSSPAAVSAPFSLAIGDTTIGVPTGGAVPTAVGIVKPAGNTATIKIKGAAGDTGIKLHPTDPDSFSLDSTQATIILNASALVTGVQLIWS